MTDGGLSHEGQMDFTFLKKKNKFAYGAGYCYLCHSWGVSSTKRTKTYLVSEFRSVTLLIVLCSQHFWRCVYFFHTNSAALSQSHQAWLVLHSLCCHLGHQIKGSKSGVDKVVTVTAHLDGIQPVPHSGESGIVWHTAVKQWLGYPTLKSGGGGWRKRKRERESGLRSSLNCLHGPPHTPRWAPPLHLSTSPPLLSSPLSSSLCLGSCLQRGRGWNVWVGGVGWGTFMTVEKTGWRLEWWMLALQLVRRDSVYRTDVSFGLKWKLWENLPFLVTGRCQGVGQTCK